MPVHLSTYEVYRSFVASLFLRRLPLATDRGDDAAILFHCFEDHGFLFHFYHPPYLTVAAQALISAIFSAFLLSSPTTLQTPQFSMPIKAVICLK